MINFIKLLTKDNITFIIAVIGFILSLWNFFKSLYENRSKTKLTYKSCTIVKEYEKALYFELSIENLSKLPISISRIFYIKNNIEYEFQWKPKRLFLEHSEHNGNALDIDTYFSQEIPHTIDGLGIWGGLFFMKLEQLPQKSDIANAQNQIVLYTNRGIKTFDIPITEDTINIRNDLI